MAVTAWPTGLHPELRQLRLRKLIGAPDMTDTIEAVAQEVQRAVEQMPYRQYTELTADGSAERPTTLREFFENTWQGEHADEVFSAAANVATRAAITAHTKALIEGARQAAATIAALKAEIERLTEREAQAKLDGVRAGIEAAKEEWTDSWTIFECRIRALDAEAIAKGEG